MRGASGSPTVFDLAIIVPCYRDDEAVCQFLDLHENLFADVPLVVIQGQEAAGAVSVAVQSDSRATGLTPNSLHSTVLSSPGRGTQIAAGIANVQARWYWILHADSRIPESTFDAVTAVARQADSGWGRCSVRLPGLTLIARMMNLRSRLTRICTGDQGMFIAAQTLCSIGGFPQQPLMEDIEVSRQLKRTAAEFYPLADAVVGSSRRWQQRGVVKTVLSMWWYRLRYFFGASAQQLYRSYYAR